MTGAHATANDAAGCLVRIVRSYLMCTSYSSSPPPYSWAASIFNLWVVDLQVQSPHETYPPMTVSRTPLGGWQLCNIHVIMLSHAATSSSAKADSSISEQPDTDSKVPIPVCEQHFGKGAMKLL